MTCNAEHICQTLDAAESFDTSTTLPDTAAQETGRAEMVQDAVNSDQELLDTGECPSSVATGCSQPPTVPPQAVRLSRFQIGPDGKPGSGLDIDNDAQTCAPAGKCSEGIDNAMQPLGQLANPTLQQRMESGATIFLFQTPGNPGLVPICPFIVDLLQGTPGEANELLIRPDSYSAPCQPATRFVDVQMQHTTATAGAGEDQHIEFTLTITGAALAIPVRSARLQATLEFSQSDGSLLSVDGIIAGAVVIEELLQVIAESDLDEIARTAADGIIRNYVKADIDLNGDGTDEAASIGVRIYGDQVVTVSGLAP